ncbi:MAG: hypothetical protein F4Y47_21605 [Acidobacteriia bacterium]|nr:hypothetical protein [Terriglobia bacterium]MYK11503.1 hypothetical protein [Terriglobia bacterium]
MAFDDSGNRARVASLQRRGVDVWGPERVYVSTDVNLDAIEPTAVIRQATLSGKDLSIAAGAVIGTSGHAEVSDCQIGPNVELGAGLYQGATLLNRVKVRGFAEIRPGTLLEEEVDIAHSVALKNTTFTACCVAGSLINFCDLFLTGGTSRKDHTEIGSGAIHYNFDPRGDKWGSLLGSIRGVLLRSDPVFIGGTCGLVGPLEVGLGAVTAANCTIRKDVPANTLVSTDDRAVSIPNFDRTAYAGLRRQFRVTAKLVATLRALEAWYELVRLPHAPSRERHLYEFAMKRVGVQAQERIDRLAKIVAKLEVRAPTSPAWIQTEHRQLVRCWPDLRNTLQQPVKPQLPPTRFTQAYAEARGSGQSHLAALKAAEVLAAEAEAWLERIVNSTMQAVDPMLTEPAGKSSG